MRLQSRVLIILSGMWLLICLLVFLDSKMILDKEYERQEIKQVTADISRADKALGAMQDSLKLLNLDWAQWNDAYYFMQNKDNNFIENNLIETTYQNTKLNFILFFDSLGNLFFGKYYDLIHNKYTEMPNGLKNYFKTNAFHLYLTNPNSTKSGMIALPEGYFLISSSPILMSNGMGPAAGVVVMGYEFNETHMQILAKTVELPLQLFSITSIQKNPGLKTAFANLQDNNRYYVIPENQRFIAGYTLVRDINNNPVALLGMTLPRILFNEGLATVKRYQLIVLSLGILVLASVWYLLKIFVLNRILAVGNQVVAISETQDFSKRIRVLSNDELADMVSAMNKLLEMIELMQEQLKNRVLKDSKNLKRVLALNKNLDTEINNYKMLEDKLLKGEKALRQLAYYDVLTGLPNRVMLESYFQKATDYSKDNGTYLAVFYLDNDKFKKVNDTHGHYIGDKFLQHIAKQLKNNIKENDFLARISGDEFIILLSDITDKKVIKEYAEKFLQNASQPFKIDAIEMKASFSIGISIYPQDALLLKDLEKYADLAMYHAKKCSGNAYYFYHEIKKTSTGRPTQLKHTH